MCSDISNLEVSEQKKLLLDFSGNTRRIFDMSKSWLKVLLLLKKDGKDTNFYLGKEKIYIDLLHRYKELRNECIFQFSKSLN